MTKSSEKTAKKIEVIVKENAKTDFVRFNGVLIGKNEAVEVSDKILENKRLNPLLTVI